MRAIVPTYNIDIILFFFFSGIKSLDGIMGNVHDLRSGPFGDVILMGQWGKYSNSDNRCLTRPASARLRPA